MKKVGEKRSSPADIGDSIPKKGRTHDNAAEFGESIMKKGRITRENIAENREGKRKPKPKLRFSKRLASRW